MCLVYAENAIFIWIRFSCISKTTGEFGAEKPAYKRQRSRVSTSSEKGDHLVKTQPSVNKETKEEKVEEVNLQMILNIFLLITFISQTTYGVCLDIKYNYQVYAFIIPLR